MTRTRSSRSSQQFHWAEALTCDVAASVVLRGAQSTSIRTGEDATGRHIAVTIGRILLYLNDRHAVLSHTRAWLKAQDMAERASPAGHISPEPRNANDRDRPLMVATAVVQCARAQSPVSVDGATTAVAGHPYVQVQVGRLTVVCLDQPAVQSVAACWQNVAPVLADLFPDEDEVAERRRAAAAFERSIRPVTVASPALTPSPSTDISRTADRLAALEARVGRLERRQEEASGG
jgi:hypothetical protein